MAKLMFFVFEPDVPDMYLFGVFDSEKEASEHSIFIRATTKYKTDVGKIEYKPNNNTPIHEKLV